MDTTTSLDGTTLAYERTGQGPALILIGGAFCDRTTPVSGTALAARLAHRFTVYSYDRRGRGDSADTPPHAVDREREDLRALIDAAGGTASVFGNSSGALLALDAAARGAPIDALVCYEPPVILDPARAEALMGLADRLAATVAEGRRGDAVELYLTQVMQLPAPAFAQLRGSPMWPGLQSLAHTLPYDLRLTARGPARLAEAAAIRARTRLLSGGASPAWMRAAIDTLARAIPGADHRTLDGQTHAVEVAVLAEEIEVFLGGLAFRPAGGTLTGAPR